MRINHRGGAPDLSIVELGSEKPIVLIEFKVSNEQRVVGGGFSQLLHYKRLYGCFFAYIVCPSLDKSSERFEIYKIIGDGYESLSSINDFPAYEDVIRDLGKMGASGGEGGDDELTLIMGYADKEAKDMGLEYTGSEHVLMGILRADVGIGAEVLRQFKIDAEEVRRRIEKEKQPEEKTVGTLWQGGLTKAIIKYAREKSQGRGNVRSEYVLLGILELTLKESLALRILKRMGVNFEEMRQATLALMGEPGEEIGVAPEVEGEVEVGEGSEVRVVTNVVGNVATIRIDDIGNEDRLGREKLVKTLAGMFAQTDCGNGFTIALLGDWGEGKSTVMGLLQTELEGKHKGKFKFATYNAWEYEKAENVPAGIAQEVVKGLTGKIGEWEKRWLRIKFACREHNEKLRRLGIMMLLVLDIALIWLDIVLLFDEMASWYKIISTFFGLSIIGLPLVQFKDLKKIYEHPLSTQLQTYLKLPDYGEYLGLVPVLKRHIRTLCDFQLDEKKLIVFVDDLDRCNADHIAKVLDAIRLVMTIPNVIVMIGIDHRIAFKAIRKHYDEELADGNDRKEAAAAAAEIARDYLGKIIQLPVRLRAANHGELKGYVFEKLFDKNSIVDDSELVEETPEDEVLPVAVDIDELVIKEDVIEQETTKTIEDKIEEEINEAIRDTISERDMFYKLVGTFDFSNPRQLLRLHNSFRFLKGFGSGKGEGYDTLDMLRMLFWQEFLYNRPREVRNQCMAALVDEGYIEKAEPEVRRVLKKVRDDIVKIFSDQKYYKELAEFVRIVVLPHNEEGIFDSKEEIDEWIEVKEKEAEKKKVEDGFLPARLCRNYIKTHFILQIDMLQCNK